MLPTQLVFYRRSESLDRRLDWSSFPYELLERRGEITRAGVFAYPSTFLRQVEYQRPQRVSEMAHTSAGGWVSDRGEAMKNDPTHCALAPLRVLRTRPCLPTEDARALIPSAQVLAGPLRGETTAYAQLKTLNYVLSAHRFYGSRGAALKHDWKASEPERLDRFQRVCSLVSLGHKYTGMFARLLLSFYARMYVEHYCVDNKVRDVCVVDLETPTDVASFKMPGIHFCDAKVPRFRDWVARVWRVPIVVAIAPPYTAHNYAQGYFVLRANVNVMLRYDLEAALILDFGTWARPAATIAAGEVNLRTAELDFMVHSRRDGVREIQPSELVEATIGGEALLFEKIGEIHRGVDVLLDVEGAQDAERMAKITPASMRTLRTSLNSVPVSLWLDAIRWLLMKTGCENDLFEADEIVSARCICNTVDFCHGRTGALIAPLDGLHSGRVLRLPLDYTLPAYLYPYREYSGLRSSREWLSLWPMMRLNMHYYMCIMLANATYWANFATSMQRDCWNTKSGNAANAKISARRRHGCELLTRYSAYAVSLYDKVVMNACAHMYGWAPMKSTMLSCTSTRKQSTSCVNFTAQLFDVLFEEHVVPNSNHPYFEAWLLRSIPDFLTLPLPEGTIQWPVDKPKPLINPASDASQMRLSATLPSFDDKYWLADGGQAYSAQYYVASNATDDLTDPATYKFGTAANQVRFGQWCKPVQSHWPTAPAIVDPTTYMMTGVFRDYFAPAMMRMYSHESKLPLVWGVQRVTATGTRIPGPVRSWYDITQGELRVAPTLTYIPPLWGERDVEPVADAYIAAMVDSEDERFLGYHWANVARIDNAAKGEMSTRLVTLLTSQPISDPAALANDNDPHEPARGRKWMSTKAPHSTTW
ncbi:hypothetical protein PsorP6_009287 [Peronosclerospora sorghi]|uniref:Uncharacterized protein n=1 Tax=Peronosclerospora sorghi TaxID=230839 RepID=A0ACC0W0Y6_9STRA|nr:hypothetical protein PsorP6_009287 [Peronosclerospora sorghi]